ncbi:MAG: putative glycosyl transferase [Methanomassiliicoccales archaeon PtaU1.Bin124]|nr:MAG: putative glycosyl transferase [Methanomassiliicoccales archaeon PtaU1.Bin124]
MGRQFNKYFNDVYIFTIDEEDEYPSAIRFLKINIDNLNVHKFKIKRFSGDLFPNFNLMKKLIFLKPNKIVILASETTASLSLIAVGKILNANMVIIIENNLDRTNNMKGVLKFLSSVKKKFIKFVYKNIINIVAESDMNKKYLQEEFKISNSIVKTHGICLEKYSKNGILGIDENLADLLKNHKFKSVVLYAGGFYKVKGIDSVLSIQQHVIEKNYLLIIINFGNLKDLNKIIPSNNIILIDPVKPENMIFLYNAVDIVIMPSITEHVAEISPNVLMEAMASHKCIIASNIGGIPTILKDGGILIPEGDVDALRNSIDLLSDNPEIAQKYSDRALEIVRKEYSIINYSEFIAHL